MVERLIREVASDRRCWTRYLTALRQRPWTYHLPQVNLLVDDVERFWELTDDGAQRGRPATEWSSQRRELIVQIEALWRDDLLEWVTQLGVGLQPPFRRLRPTRGRNPYSNQEYWEVEIAGDKTGITFDPAKRNPPEHLPPDARQRLFTVVEALNQVKIYSGYTWITAYTRRHNALLFAMDDQFVQVAYWDPSTL